MLIHLMELKILEGTRASTHPSFNRDGDEPLGQKLDVHDLGVLNFDLPGYVKLQKIRPTVE